MTRLLIKDTEGTTYLKTYDMFHLQADRSSTHFYLATGEKLTISRPLKHWLEELAPCNKYIRIHESHAVNKHEIRRIECDCVFLSNGKEVPMDPNIKEEVEALFTAINASLAKPNKSGG